MAKKLKNHIIEDIPEEDCNPDIEIDLPQLPSLKNKVKKFKNLEDSKPIVKKTNKKFK